MNYSDLQTAVANFLNRSDLYASIPVFIAMTESSMNRRLRVREMIVRAQDVSVASEFQAVPTDFSGPISMTLSTGEVLDNMSPDEINFQKYRNASLGGTPTAYAVVGGQFQFNPIPSGTTPLTAVMSYWGNLPALSAGNPSNWLLAEYPDAYLYGALCEAGMFMVGGDRRLPAWEARHHEILDQIEASDRAESFGARLTPQASLVV